MMSEAEVVATVLGPACLRRSSRKTLAITVQPDGATHRYLGKQYRLKVSQGAPIGVKLAGSFFHVVTRHGSESEVERLLSSWMRERALHHLKRRLETWGANPPDAYGDN